MIAISAQSSKQRVFSDALDSVEDHRWNDLQVLLLLVRLRRWFETLNAERILSRLLSLSTKRTELLGIVILSVRIGKEWIAQESLIVVSVSHSDGIVLRMPMVLMMVALESS